MTKRMEVEGHSICTHCALKFESVQELKTHSSRTHRKYKFECECGNSFPTKAAKKEHYESHSVLEGESTSVHCNIMFESSEYLHIHTFNEHKKYEYHCQCRNAFPTKAAMDQHFNELHSQKLLHFKVKKKKNKRRPA